MEGNSINSRHCEFFFCFFGSKIMNFPCSARLSLVFLSRRKKGKQTKESKSIVKWHKVNVREMSPHLGRGMAEGRKNDLAIKILMFDISPSERKGRRGGGKIFNFSKAKGRTRS